MILDIAKELKMLRNMRVTVIQTNWWAWNGPKKFGELEKFGNQRENPDHLNYSIAVIGKNTEKSPGDQRRLHAIQTSVNDH